MSSPSTASSDGAVLRLLGLVGDPAGQQVAQLADPGVARGDAVTQMVLLAGELVAQRNILRFQLTEPPDVGPIGRAHQVGKHVDFAEDLADQRVVGDSMGERRPIAARNIALLDGLTPQGAYLVDRLGPLEAADDEAMALVERLVQQFAPSIAQIGQQHALAVQVMVGRAVGGHAGLGQDLAQLAGRQAGADDRAVEMVGEFPDLRSTRNARKLLVEFGLDHPWRQRDDRRAAQDTGCTGLGTERPGIEAKRRGHRASSVDIFIGI